MAECTVTAVNVGDTTKEVALDTAVVRAKLLNTTAAACIFLVKDPLLTASMRAIVTVLNAFVALELSTRTRCATTVTVYRTLTVVVDKRLK